MSPYQLTVNLEITSKCNARCIMCPRDNIQHPQLMKPATFHKAMQRINATDVARVVLAGFGEPTTHPLLSEFLDSMREHPVRFDMVTNAQQLDEELLKKINGRLGLLMISFSSIDRRIYESVHVNLDYDRVINNIKLARKILSQTKLAISLSPVPQALSSIDETIGWLHDQHITGLTMSPTLYNRAGADTSLDLHTRKLRDTIDRYQLQSQELDFITGPSDFLKQWQANKVTCVARNSVIFLAADGAYLDCFNDINHKYPLGHINEMTIRQALDKREKSVRNSDLCADCNLRDRYRSRELLQVALKHGKQKLISAFQLPTDKAGLVHGHQRRYG